MDSRWQGHKGWGFLALHAVQYNHSYNSFDDLILLLQKIGPDSKVLAGINLGKSKVSTVISHSLYTHFHAKLINNVKQSPGFSLGTDTATFHHLGLSKHGDNRTDEVKLSSRRNIFKGMNTVSLIKV